MKTVDSTAPEPTPQDSPGRSLPASFPPELLSAFRTAEAHPDDLKAWERMDELAREVQRPDEVARLYRHVLGEDLPVEVGVDVGRRAVAFHDEWYEDPDPVADILKRILKLDPDQQWAFERLSLLLTMGERWEELLREYDQAIAACQAADLKQKLLEEAARIAKDFAGQARRANDYLKHLVLLKPQDEQLVGTVERRLEQEERHSDLIEIWQKRLGVVDKDEALKLRLRIAERFLKSLGDVSAALDGVNEFLKNGGDEEPACRILEDIAGRKNVEQAAQSSALSSLRRIYTKAERAADVTRIVEMMLPLSGSDDERVELHQEALIWLERQDRLTEAIAHCASLMVLVPQSEEAKQTLLRLTQATGAHARYADILIDAAGHCSHSDRRINLLLEAAKVREQVSDDAGATEVFFQVLADPGADSAAKLVATRRLSALLVADHQTGERLSVLERQAALEEDPEQRRYVLGEAARLAHSLNDPDRALGLWRTRIDDDPGDLEALDARIEILESHGRHRELIGDLRERATQARDAQHRRQDLTRIAVIFERQLNDPQNAIETWCEVKESFGADADAVDALTDLYVRTEQWQPAVSLLEAAVQSEPDPLRRTDQFSKLGDIYRVHCRDVQRAVHYYRTALRENPTHDVSRQGLRILMDDPTCAAAAVESLAEALKSAEEWSAILELVEPRLAACSDNAAQRGILLEAASIAEQHENSSQLQLGFLQRAFALGCEPTDEREMCRVAELLNDFESTVRAYEQAIATSAPPERLVELYFAKGRILEERLNEPRAAAEAFSWIISQDPSDLDAVRALLRSAGRFQGWQVAAWAWVAATQASGINEQVLGDIETIAEQDWTAMTQAAAERIAETPDLSARTLHDLKRQLGVWHRDRREDTEAAERAFSEAVQAEQDADTLGMLAELQRAHPSEALVRTLLALADVTHHTLAPLYEAAKVALTSVGDSKLAKPILERSLAIAAQIMKSGREAQETELAREVAPWALESLVELTLEAGEATLAMQLLIDGARLPFNLQESITLRFRAAEIADLLLDDSATAIDLCREILGEARDDARTIELLGALYKKERRLEDLLKLRRSELGQNPPLERRLVLRLEEARVLRELGADIGEAIQVLEQNLDEQAGHVESIELLATILGEAGRYDDLHRMLSAQAVLVTEAGDQDAAADLWARAGHVAQHAINDVEQALTAYRASIDQEPSLEVLDALAAIHTEHGEHSDAAGWLIQRLEMTPRSEAARAIRRSTIVKLAEALASSQDQDRAEQYLREGLADDPGCETMRELLANMYRERGRFNSLAPLLAEGADHTEAVERKITYLRDAAEVERRMLHDLNAAIPLLERAVKLDPTDRSLRLRLSDALRQAARYDESRELLEGMLAEFGRRRTSERATVHYYLAKIGQASGELDQALEHLEAAAGIQRGDPVVLKLLGDVARANREFERAERAYRALLLVVGRGSPQSGNRPAVLDHEDAATIGQSSILFTLSRMAEEMEQPDRAKDLLDSALETAAQDPGEAKRLEQVMREDGCTDLLLQALEQRLQLTNDARLGAEILLHKAEILREQDREDEALDACFLGLQRDAGNETLLTLARELADSLDRTPEFFDQLGALAETAEASNPDLACWLWLYLGRAEEFENQRSDRALALYQKAQATGCSPIETFQAVDRVVDVSQDPDAELVALQQFTEAADGATQADLMASALYRLGELELRRGQLEAGAANLQRALDTQEDAGRCLPLVEAVFEQGGSSPPLCRLYERLARSVGDKDVLLAALWRCSELGDVTLNELKEAVEIAEELGAADRIAGLLERTVAVARRTGALDDVAWALGDLARHREEAGDVEGAASLLREAIDVVPDYDRFDLRLRWANLAAGPLGDLQAAASVYEELLQEEPTNAKVWRPLLDVYRKCGDGDKLEACLSVLEETVVDPAERSDLRMQRIRILLDAERLSDVEHSLRTLLDEEPDYEPALELLAGLLSKMDRTDELTELLATQFETACWRDDGESVARIALQLAPLLKNRNEGPSEAVRVLHTSLKWAPDRREIVEKLLDLFEEADTSVERGDAMECLLSMEQGPKASALAMKLADIRSAHRDEVARGRALELGFEKASTDDELKQRLFAWYWRHGEHERLVDTLLRDAARRQYSEDTLDEIEETARRFSEQLGDDKLAVRLVDRAVEHAGCDTALLRLLITYELKADLHGSAEQRATAAIDSGEADDEKLGELLFLRGTLRAAREEGIQALTDAADDFWQAKALGREGVEANLSAVLERIRALSQEQADGDRERDATLKLVSVLPAAGETQRAAQLLVAWVREHPLDAGAIRRLGQFATSRQKWPAAVQAYRRLVEVTEGDERASAALLLADASEALGDPEGAREALENAYKESPHHEKLRERLCKMFEALGAHAQLGAMLLEQADREADPDMKFELYCEAGEHLSQGQDESDKQDNSAALDAFKKARELRPGSHSVIVKIVEAQLDMGLLEDAETLLDEAMTGQNKRRSPERSELLHLKAQISRIFSDFDKEQEYLEAALQCDRQNGVVAAELATLAMDRDELDVAMRALQLITLLKKPGPMSRAEAYLRQAMIARRRGNSKKAILMGKRALTAQPDLADARSFLAELGAL